MIFFHFIAQIWMMAAESSFQTLKMKPSSSEKTTFSNKVEQRAVIKFCVDIGKTPTEMHKFIKRSVTHSNVSRSLVFKWHKRFSDGRGSLMDDKRERWPSFKTSDVCEKWSTRRYWRWQTFNCAWSCGQVCYIKDNGTWNFSSRTTHESHLCAIGTQNVIRRKYDKQNWGIKTIS